MALVLVAVWIVPASCASAGAGRQLPEAGTTATAFLHPALTARRPRSRRHLTSLDQATWKHPKARSSQRSRTLFKARGEAVPRELDHDAHICGSDPGPGGLLPERRAGLQPGLHAPAAAAAGGRQGPFGRSGNHTPVAAGSRRPVQARRGPPPSRPPPPVPPPVPHQALAGMTVF